MLPLAELEVESEAPAGVHIRALDGLTEDEKKVARERFEAIRPLLEMPRYGRKDVEARAKETGYSVQESLPDCSSQVSGNSGDYHVTGGRKAWMAERTTTRLAADAEAIITEVIEQLLPDPAATGPKSRRQGSEEAVREAWHQGAKRQHDTVETREDRREGEARKAGGARQGAQALQSRRPNTSPTRTSPSRQCRSTIPKET